jgi:hypothetical protein
VAPTVAANRDPLVPRPPRPRTLPSTSPSVCLLALRPAPLLPRHSPLILLLLCLPPRLPLYLLLSPLPLPLLPVVRSSVSPGTARTTLPLLLTLLSVMLLSMFYLLSSQNVAYALSSSLYTWSPYEPGPNIAGLDFLAMLWGPTQQADWNKLVVPGYSNIALALNE